MNTAKQRKKNLHKRSKINCVIKEAVFCGLLFFATLIGFFIKMVSVMSYKLITTADVEEIMKEK